MQEIEDPMVTQIYIQRALVQRVREMLDTGESFSAFVREAIRREADRRDSSRSRRTKRV